MNKDVLRADWLMLLAAFIWGSAFVAQKIGMDYVGPLTYNGARFALGALILLPLALKKGRVSRIREELPDFRGISPLIWGGFLSGFIIFAGAALQQAGLIYTTAGKAGFITCLYVIIVPFLSLFWGYKINTGGWLGCVLALIGLYLLSTIEDTSMAFGDFLTLLGAFFWAGHVILISWLAPRLNVIRLACVQFTFCSGLSLIGALFFEEITIASLIDCTMPILYGGLLSVGIGYTLQVIGQKDAPPVHAAVILSMEAVFSVFAGWLILNESLTISNIFGCILMLAGMLSVQLWPDKKISNQ